MDQEERKTTWVPDTAIFEITRFFQVSYLPPSLRDVEGVETWVELHLRPVQNPLDQTKEAMVSTHDGKAYPVCVEGTAHIHPTSESVRTGFWRPGDCLVFVSGIPYEALQAGDLLIQEKNAKERAPRKWKNTSE
jgi:hypothetical protein